MDTIKDGESSGITFKKAQLAQFLLIDDIGKYDLPVFSNVTDRALVLDEDGTKPRYIVNLKAIAADKFAQLKALFATREEVPIEETNGLFMTANIWKNNEQEPALPLKGELLECMVGIVPNREGQPVLRVVSHRVHAAKKAAKVDLLNFFKEEKALQGALENMEEVGETLSV